MASIPKIGLLGRLADLLTAARYVVQGDSMLPYLEEGQYILVNRRAYRRTNPARGDVVVLRHPAGAGRSFIKRIVGLPGEQVEVGGGGVSIAEAAAPSPSPLAEEGSSGVRYLLGEGQYFVVGDNLQESDDSRNFGPVDREMILGRVWIRYWPLATWKVLT